jgi:exonuclease SbcD
MPIRIVHTADNHIGLPFRQYPGDIRSKLREERFAALGRLVGAANERQADFFVVAGDLFDSTRVSAIDIRSTVELLNAFAGVAVLVVPGNHDHFTGPETEVWKRFRGFIEGAGSIHLLTDPAVQTYEAGGQLIHFFPCPCPSKTGAEPTIGWVAAAAGEHPKGLRIGIAHGNVTGLGLDAEGQYFNMSPDDLEKAGLATWLLGHIHVPFPTTVAGERSPYFMAGTHTPDSIRCRHAGSAWFIECDGDHVTSFERLSPGAVRFVRIEQQLTTADDVAMFIRSCEAWKAGRTVLDLQLTGRLSAAERAELAAAIDRLRHGFLSLTDELDIRDRIDAPQIEARHRKGGLAHRLLTALLADKHHPDAATLAHELIEEVNES